MPGITLARRRGQRLLATPGLNHNVLRQIRLQNFIPSFHALAVVRHNFFHALVEQCLQRGGVSDVVRFHELADMRLAGPGFRADLVAADVKVFVGKQLYHLADEAVEKPISGFFGRDR